MTLITDSRSVKDICISLAREPFICIDTEFMREGTYWPRLCLIQLADSESNSFAVDPLAPHIDLAPLFDLLANKLVPKVIHAARQDIEIFFYLTGAAPNPIFDTQVAAMVCGFGEAVSYETLVRKLTDARIDKSSRFSDWSRRPLQKRQLEYALADVTYLPQIYRQLHEELVTKGRNGWVSEEMAALCSTAIYDLDPIDAWRKVKTRGAGPRTLAILREIAAVRERWARRHDLPRQRLIRDESLLEVASSRPNNAAQLGRIRGFSEGAAKGTLGSDLLKGIVRGLEVAKEECPQPPKQKETVNASRAAVELLKALLKMRCEQHGVAQKLVAKTSDLVEIAAGVSTVPALAGWRHDIFGSDALKLMGGTLALSINDGTICVIDAQVTNLKEEESANEV